MPAAPAARAIVYSDISLCSDEYTEMKPVRAAIEDFYTGGYVLAKKVANYIPRLLGENPRRYNERVRSGAYINYFGQITDYYASALFTQEVSVRPAADAEDASSLGDEPEDDDVYTKLSKNSDGNGHTLNEVMHDVIVTALKNRSAWVHVELPPAQPVASKADEDALGLGLPWLFEVPADQIIDWDYDDDGELVYAVVNQVKKLKGPPGRRRNKTRETFEVWTREVGDGDAEPVVSWARYVIEYDDQHPPQPHTECVLEEEGETSFRRIPLLEMKLPDGLWLGNKLCPMAKEHFARRTTLNAAENRSMVAIPVVKLGSEIPAPGGAISEAQENPARGEDPVATFVAKGYEVIGKDDSIEFAEPEGHAYAHVAKRIDDLKDEMFRVAHQMSASVSMNAGMVKRSGQSKQEDRLAESLVLAAVGRIVRNFAVRIYDTISTARGEDIVWVPHGLDTYELEDREQVLEESLALQAVDIPSPTFRKEHAKRVARKVVPNMPPATIAKIDKEIESGVDDQQTVRDLEHDNEVDDLKNPPEVVPPTAPIPAAKAPAAKSPKGPPAKAPGKKAA
jgi:hypothetical protein